MTYVRLVGFCFDEKGMKKCSKRIDFSDSLFQRPYEICFIGFVSWQVPDVAKASSLAKNIQKDNKIVLKEESIFLEFVVLVFHISLRHGYT